MQVANVPAGRAAIETSRKALEYLEAHALASAEAETGSVQARVPFLPSLVKEPFKPVTEVCQLEQGIFCGCLMAAFTGYILTAIRCSIPASANLS